MADSDRSGESPSGPEPTIDSAAAAVRTGLTTQRLRDLAVAGEVACEITQHGKRKEYKFDAADVERLAAERQARPRGRKVTQATAQPLVRAADDGELKRLQAESVVLRTQLEMEKRGRAVAEARIDELNRTVARQAQAIRALTVDGLDPDEVLRGSQS